MGAAHRGRGVPLCAAVTLLGVIFAAAAAATSATAATHPPPYPTGRDPLLSPEAIAAALPPGVTCGAPLPGTRHVLHCGPGPAVPVPVGAVVFEPPAEAPAGRGGGGGGGGDGCAPTTLLFLHGQAVSPMADYFPLVVLLARLPAASRVRVVMPLAPHHPTVRVAAANGSATAGAAAWYNFYAPPAGRAAATAAAATDGAALRAAVAAWPWAVDSLGLALSAWRLATVAATEAAGGARRVVVLGHSLGAGMGLHLAAMAPRGVVGAVLAVAGQLPLADLHVSGVVSTAGAGPVVVLHGEADGVIPAAEGRAAAAVWAGGRGGGRFRSVDGRGHADVLLSPAMDEEVTALLLGGGGGGGEGGEAPPPHP